MAKLLFPLFLVVILGVAGYFLFIDKSTSILPLISNQTAQVITQPVGKTPEAGSSGSQKPIIATDEAINEDMTALDQDLANLKKADADFTADLGGI